LQVTDKKQKMRLNYGQFPSIPSTAWIVLVPQVLRSFEKNPKNYGQKQAERKTRGKCALEHKIRKK
jgi:hypothetical protein